MNALEKEICGSGKFLMSQGNKHWGKQFSYEDIEDLVQGTMIAAVTGQKNYRGDSKVSTWLVAIFRNKALSKLRYRREFVSIDDVTENQDGNQMEAIVLAVDATQETGLQAQQTETVIQKLVARLPAHHRYIVTRVYFQEQGLDDAAKDIGIAPSTAKTRIFYARKRLQPDLSKDFLAA